MPEETQSFDNWGETEWKDQFRQLRTNSLGAIFELGKYVQEFRREFRAHPERWGGNAQWSTVCVNITGLSNSTCSMYETVWRVLGSVKECETHWRRDKLPSSLRTLYHIARAYEIEPSTVHLAMMDCSNCGTPYSKHPIHPDMSREDAEKLVEEAKERLEGLNYIEWLPTWHRTLFEGWLDAGVSKQVLGNLLWKDEALWNIYKIRNDQKYMDGLVEHLTAFVKKADEERTYEKGWLGVSWEESEMDKPLKNEDWLCSAKLVEQLANPVR